MSVHVNKRKNDKWFIRLNSLVLLIFAFGFIYFNTLHQKRRLREWVINNIRKAIAFIWIKRRQKLFTVLFALFKYRSDTVKSDIDNEIGGPIQKVCIPVGCVPPASVTAGRGRSLSWGSLSRGSLSGGSLFRGLCPEEDPLYIDPPEGTWDQGQRPPGRNMGWDSQTGSDIIQRQQSVKTYMDNWTAERSSNLIAYVCLSFRILTGECFMYPESEDS